MYVIIFLSVRRCVFTFIGVFRGKLLHIKTIQQQKTKQNNEKSKTGERNK